ncbi:hypothetical protein BASA81_009186 [Batrachochytrium salamandrivorans]|nr:hypothetical protein BASA81_009186 [Batrachochytrium salamandrivorans]
MIIPLLAVVASGSTIPSTDSYNVQQLEKRGDSDPDIKESAVEELKARLMLEYEAKRQALSKASDQRLMEIKKLERLGKQGAQVNIDLQNEMDKDKEKEKDPMESSSSSEEFRKLQRSISKATLEFMEEFDQEPSKMQDEVAIRDALNEKNEVAIRDAPNERLSETQVQATVWPSSMSQLRTMSINLIWSLLKMSQDCFRGANTGPEQIDNEYQKITGEIERIEEIEEILVKKSPNKY